MANFQDKRKEIMQNKLFPVLLGLTLAVVLWISFSGPLSLADLKIFDTAFEFRGPRSLQDRTVILAIDEQSFQKVEAPLALWSGDFALVFNYLACGGAKVIGFDLIQAKSFENFAAEGNQKFLEILEQIESEGKPGLVFVYLPDKKLYPFEELNYLLVEGNALGYGNLTLDEDKIVRRQKIYALEKGIVVPSFALNICSKFLGKDCQALSEEMTGKEVNYSGGLTNAILLNFRGPAGTFPRLSFAEALEKARSNDLDYFKKNFSGRIVLVGLDTAEDTAPVAYSGQWSHSVLMPGVEIHANTIETILSGEFIRETSPFALWGIPFALFSILICWFFFRLSLFWGAAFSLVLLAVFLYIFDFLFRTDWYFAPAAALTLILVAPLITYSYRFLVEGREKRKISRIFRTYVNEKVLEELVSREDYAVFSVKRLPVALMFTDVRNFTTISENLDPELVARLLNDYMSEMCKAIFEFGGTVNKFIGDGIMALWGAPIEDEKACYHAIRSALRMLDYLEKFNQHWEAQGYPHFAIGVGIHYATVAVGYLGHPDRMEYTALGDGVNTASRVEGLNKQLKTTILITEEVYRQVEKQFEVSQPQILSIKGRSDVKVYPVLGIKHGG